MKQIFSKITIKLMLTVATITLIIGCSDVLDEDPLVQLSTEQFYQNETDALAALSGAYARLK